jgi:hypothetical protein
MEKEQIIPEDIQKEANEKYSDDGYKDEIYCDIGQRDRGIYIQGRIDERAKGKQWTDEDMLSAFKAGTDNETLVETGIGMYPNHQYNPEEWLKLYKQSKSNADN